MSPFGRTQTPCARRRLLRDWLPLSCRAGKCKGAIIEALNLPVRVKNRAYPCSAIERSVIRNDLSAVLRSRSLNAVWEESRDDLRNTHLYVGAAQPGRGRKTLG